VLSTSGYLPQPRSFPGWLAQDLVDTAMLILKTQDPLPKRLHPIEVEDVLLNPGRSQIGNFYKLMSTCLAALINQFRVPLRTVVGA
jgi:hypothetical protein